MNIDPAISGGSLAALKRDAASKPQDEATLRQVARQFEALLTQQVLKASRATALGEDLMGGSGLDLYKDLFDQQMAQQISSGQGLGLADVLVQQLRGAKVESALKPPVPTEPSTPPSSTNRVTSFVKSIWQQAEKAAQALGLPTEAVVGHAALETGWGAHQPGGDSHNLFGIKASARWQGESVRAATTEMDGGRTRTEQAEFRAYHSTEQGMADYVRFLKSNPRYAEAIKAGSTPQQFAEGLQKAGYATDPQYAAKLKAAIASAAAARPAI